MRALSIRQPWAWLILFGGKDVENRSWKTNFRGPVLIHASKGLTRREYDEVNAWSCLPPFESLERGGIVGSVEIVDCLLESDSPWHNFGSFGFVLRNPQPMEFIPCAGMLGFFTPNLPTSSVVRRA